MLTYLCTLHPQAGGQWTRELRGDECHGIITYFDPAAPNGRPAQAGDILSVQPGGAWQGRPRGSNGNYELMKLDGALSFYQPGNDQDQTVPVYCFSLPGL